MKNYIAFWACIFGLLAVVLGAFGAHGLKPLLSNYQLEIYNKAVFYQFIHTLLLLFISQQIKSKLINFAAISTIVGILFFSGSLYLLACKDILPIANLLPIIGPITPIGGLFFICSWSLLAIHFLKNNTK